jgi:hypothetical protein
MNQLIISVAHHRNGDIFWGTPNEKETYVLLGNGEFILNGIMLHRIDGPAIEYTNGGEEWYQYGRPHRTNGPAVVHADGFQAWFLHGKRHREDGPALIMPAVRYASIIHEYYQNGQLHREDGPAIIRADGSCEWWLRGICEN